MLVIWLLDGWMGMAGVRSCARLYNVRDQRGFCASPSTVV